MIVKEFYIEGTRYAIHHNGNGATEPSPLVRELGTSQKHDSARFTLGLRAS